jgi:anti-anti-sigma regulatory factor
VRAYSCLEQLRWSDALRMTRMNAPPLLAIGGDVDEATYSTLVKTLYEFARGRREIHIDLSAVDYCDLAGLRAIIRLANARRTVVLHGLPAHLQTVLGILGWNSKPGLMIDNNPAGSRPPPAHPDPVRLSERRQTSNAGTRRHQDAR